MSAGAPDHVPAAPPGARAALDSHAGQMPGSDRPAAPALFGDLAGGIAGSIVSLALALSFGLLAFAPLGLAHASVGSWPVSRRRSTASS